MKLYNYALSSTSYRVRIALNLKGVPFEYVSLHLRRGEHRAPDYLRRNPAGLVPALELDDGRVLTQSPAILEWLEETRPKPPLLPADAPARARVRALAMAVACDMHPINNLRVLEYLGRDLGVSEEGRNAWYRHWVAVGFEAVEAMLAGDPATGAFCHGDAPGMADVCLVPQVFNARRYDCDLTPYPTIRRIEAACLALPAFAAAAPERWPNT